MSAWRRPSAWPRVSPDLADALIAAAVFVLVLLSLLSGGQTEDRVKLVLTPAAAALLAAACLALALRRRFPWQVWVATTAIGLVAWVEADGPTPVYLPAVLALATLATRVPISRSALAAVVSVFLPAVVIVVVTDQGLVDSFALGLAPWSGVAAMTGIAIRNQRAVVAGALDRAAQAEARQEEEAQRRVAEERLRIARDLHDVVAHHIAVVNVQAGVAQHLLRSNPDRAAEALGHVREASQTVLNEVPGLLGLLRTNEEAEPTAPTPTLAVAGDLVEQARRSGLDVTVRTTGPASALSVSADLAAYRVLQESLTNASRHGTGRAEVSLLHDAAGCSLSVRNPRTDAGPAASEAGRHGLVGMTERVHAAGGTITVGPVGPGDADWLVEAWLPAEASERAR